MAPVLDYSREDKGVTLCLDLGTYAGWCDCLPDGRFRSGHFNFSTKKFGTKGKQYLAFRIALINYRKRLEEMGFSIGKIYYEKVSFAPSMNGLQAMQRWAGWESILLSFAAAHEVECEGIGATNLKKAATGHGDGPKDDKRLAELNAKREKSNRKLYVGPTVADAVRQYGFEFTSGDEMDAQALMMYALQKEREEMTLLI